MFIIISMNSAFGREGAWRSVMPTYEYECLECGYRFDKFQGIKESSLKVCPQCQGALRRLIGAGAGIISKDKVGQSGQDRLSRCGHEAPCCGRESPCERPPCHH